MSDLRDQLRDEARKAFSGRKPAADGVLMLPSDRNPWTALDDALAAAMRVIEPEIERLTQRAEQAESQVQALIDEVLTICDSFRVAPEESPEYIYSLGRADGLIWARAAVERAMGQGERNSVAYVPKERAEQAEAAVERVRALVAGWRGTPNNLAANDVRAALDEPGPAVTGDDVRDATTRTNNR